MSEEKTKPTADRSAPETPDEPVRVPSKPVSKPKAESPKTAMEIPLPERVKPSKPFPHGGLFHGRSGSKPLSKADVETLGHLTQTGPTVLAALKAAYGWTERTRLTRAEFESKRDAWLTRPAKEG